MGQGFKVYSSSELYCKWPKVAETMTEAEKTLPIFFLTASHFVEYCTSITAQTLQQLED